MALPEQEGSQSLTCLAAIVHRVLARPYEFTNCLVLRLRNDDGRELDGSQQARQQQTHRRSRFAFTDRDIATAAIDTPGWRHAATASVL